MEFIIIEFNKFISIIIIIINSRSIINGGSSSYLL
jgi:hypothetical protein